MALRLQVSMNNHNNVAALNKVVLLGLLQQQGNTLFLVLIGAVLLGVVKDREHGAHHAHVAADVLARRAAQDRAVRVVLGDEPRRLTRVRQHENRASVQLEGGVHGARAHGLLRDEWDRLHLFDGGKNLTVARRSLRLAADACHNVDDDLRVRAFRRLTRKHHTVGAVEDSVGDVGDLSARRAGVLRHRLQHLCGADDGLAGDVALADDVLLCNEDLLRGDLDPKVAARHHDAVGFLQNLVEVVHALVVLDLRDDVDVGGAERGAHLADLLRGADERGEDKVDLLLGGELQVLFILLGHGGEIDLLAGQVAALVRRDRRRHRHDAAEGVALDALHLEPEQTVVDVDLVPGLHDVRQTRVVHVEAVLVSLRLPLQIRRHFDLVALVQHHIAVGEQARADLRALRVERDGDVHAELARGLSRVGDRQAVELVGAVAEIHTHNVHALAHQTLEGLDGLRLGADRTYDFVGAVAFGVLVQVELAVVLKLGTAERHFM
eukprot:PhM_4_TR3431/c0_g1_i2/m.50105